MFFKDSIKVDTSLFWEKKFSSIHVYFYMYVLSYIYIWWWSCGFTVSLHDACRLCLWLEQQYVVGWWWCYKRKRKKKGKCSDGNYGALRYSTKGLWHWDQCQTRRSGRFGVPKAKESKTRTSCIKLFLSGSSEIEEKFLYIKGGRFFFSLPSWISNICFFFYFLSLLFILKIKS